MSTQINLIKEVHQSERPSCYYLSLFSVDATFQERLGKYINHSTRHSNCAIKAVHYDGIFSICFFALKDIEKGMELRYHYGVTGLDWQKVCS